MLGIAGAPDSLPSDLVGSPWTLCSGGGVTTLGIGERTAGSTPLGERGLLVDDSSSDQTYLVWHGTRFAVTPSVLPALFGAVSPLQVGTAWLASVPEGPDIAPITLPGAGSPSPAAGSYAVGDLLSTPVGTGGLQYWMVTSAGLAPITALEMDVAVSQGAAKPRQITTSAATAIHRDTLPGQTTLNALPATPPSLVTTDTTRCATFTGAGTPAISVGGGLPAGTPTGSRAGDGTVLADRVSVPPGHVAVVRAMATATTPTSGYDIVTDLGIRYPVASDDVLKMLGYQPTSAVAMPAGLVRLIPAGPDLDPAAATRPVPSGSGGG
jgi:type VII secretion protein EccB